MSFLDKFRLTHLWRENITSGHEPIDPRRTALLVVDVQPEFASAARPLAGNKYTELVSHRIAALLPNFRRAGVQVYPIYFRMDSDYLRGTLFHPPESLFFKFTPVAQDKIVAKSENSSFAGVEELSGLPLQAALERDGRDTLLVCGFNLFACVLETITDIRALPYRRYLLRDLSGNGGRENAHATGHKEDFHTMRHSGARIITAEKALRALSLHQK